MKLISSLVGQVQEFSTRRTTVKLLWFVAMAYIFLWVPDIDLLFIGILHHRSIVTHSILPALIFLLLGRRAGAAPLAGAMIGLAVHLSCDLLSPAVGFGQIWLPSPIKMPIGPLTYPWLLANALIGFWLARRLAMKAFNVLAGYSLMLTVSIITALSYGLFNESSLLSSGITLVVFILSLMGAKKTLAKDPEALKRMQTASNAISVVRNSTVAGLDTFSDAMNSASHSIKNYSEDMSLRQRFRQQQRVLETIYEIARHQIAHEREVLCGSQEFQAIYSETVENWKTDTEQQEPNLKGLTDDLLKLAESDVLPRQAEDLKALQSEHRVFMLKFKHIILEDSAVAIRFKELMQDRQAQELLSQLLSCEATGTCS